MTTKLASIELKRTSLGRWIINLPSTLRPAALDWAWTGSRWVRHFDGISSEAQIANFATEEEARDYAREHVPEAR